MPCSHHSHSGQFCKHAQGLLEDVVKEAVRQRFQVYGLTEHVPRYRTQDLYPEEADLALDDLRSQFDSFLLEAHRLKSAYSSHITLLIGLETEFISDLDLESLHLLLTRFGNRVQYLVGSIHHVNGIPIDFDLATFNSALASFNALDKDPQQALFEAYFDNQYTLINRFKPEIIGHFDLCRLYTPHISFQDYPSVWSRIERNIKSAVEYGALFELNAAAFRKRWDSAYPGPDIVKARIPSLLLLLHLCLFLNCHNPSQLILAHGGRFTLSDDSHGPHAVGLNYDRLAEYLVSVGISELWHLDPATAPNAAGRNIRPVRLPGNWLEHDFWQGRLKSQEHTIS